MGRVMRLLFDLRMASWSGIGRYSIGLISALVQIDNIDIQLIVAQDDSIPESLSDISFVSAKAAPLGLAGLRELSQIADNSDADILHCPHISTPLPKVRIPLVTTLHDLTPLIVSDVMPSLGKRLAYRWLNWRAINNSDAIIVPSHATAADISHFRMEKNKPTAVIPEAADDFVIGAQTRPAIMDALPRNSFILSMGNTKPHKDLPTLLKAFARILNERADLQLLLVGESNPEFLATHLPEGVGESVHFTGRVSDDELRWLYEHATAFVFPSIYEGFGLPPLEAMSFGCPVIVADAASLPEVVGTAGLYFNPGDDAGLERALSTFLREHDYAKALSGAARKQASKFSWKKTAIETFNLYQNVLS